MGEAKNRGTFEERRAQAIADGRVKNPTETRHKRAKIRVPGEILFKVISRFESRSYSDFRHNERE